MKASYRWLCELLPSLDETPQQIAERLTGAGIEVESMHEFGAGTASLIVAEVRKIEPHPKRDKLRLVTVDRGDSLQRVVCGASNVPDPGGMVAFAPLGAELPAVGLTLTPREIGGIVSEGMLCSETELGLTGTRSEDHGILVFPPGFAKPGTPLREALPAVHDTIFDISLTPNRPDGLGHVGLARELAALSGRPFELPKPDEHKEASDARITELAEIIVEDTERCPHYGASAVLDVTVGPSPAWLRYRLESLGVRSISNIVDATNWILFLYGHPIHAFDLDLVRGQKIIVRRANAGEKLTTLDGQERKLDADDLLIADTEGGVALAGVMGGENSEIRASTRRVLIECAYFAPRGVRRASRRHGLHTEASHRFERGVDPGAVSEVLRYATSMVTTLGGGAAVKGTILAGAPLAPRKVVPLRASRIERLLGIPVPFDEGAAILERLGFTRVQKQGEGESEAAEFVVPTHRPDIHGEADLIEEIIRVRGLDTVPTVLPAVRPGAPRKRNEAEARIRKSAIEVGLSEAITYGFVSPKELAALGAPAAPFVLQNPLTEDRSVMRTSLLPGLLEALRRARRRGVVDARMFTVGARFLEPQPGTEAAASGLPEEAPSFAAILAGYRRRPLEKPVELDVYDAKGIALEIVERAMGRSARVMPQPVDERTPYLHPRGAGNILLGDRVVGVFGPLHPDVVDALDLGGEAMIIELDLRALAAIEVARPSFQPIPVLPASSRDIALVVHDDISAGSVSDAIREAAGELCESVELFDLFRSDDKLPPDTRSLAFHVVYRDPKAASDPESARTLTDTEVDARHQNVLKTVQDRFGATLRT